MPRDIFDDRLAAGFQPISDDEWRAAATKQENPEAELRTEIEPGLSAKWLYVPADSLAPDPAGLPGHSPFTRGPRAGRPWLIRQECRQPDRDRANREILEDLNGGTSAVLVRLDRAAQEALDPASPDFQARRGLDGIAISTLDDLAATLDGVYLDLAPVALDAPGAELAAAALLAGLWRQNGIAPEKALGSFRIDPLGTLARQGRLRRPPRQELKLAAAVAAEVAALFPALPATGHPGVTALAVDTSPYVNAGASAVWELGIALATGVEYLRACESAGLTPAKAAARIEFTFAVGPDQFLELAKFRAARRLWARVLEESGVGEEQRFSPLFGRTSDRMLSALDPWTNMLRVTTAAFAAGLGGADGVTVTAFDRDHAAAAAGPGEVAAPNELGRRIARNTQIILQQESSLANLADPAAGSWYVESLTNDLAQAAWQKFGEIESRGGALEALTSGWIATELAQLADLRRAELARRDRLMTGVNIYPLLGGDSVEVEPQDRAELARRDADRLAAKASSGRLGELATRAEQVLADEEAPASHGLFGLAVSLAEGGARLDEIAQALAGEPYEQAPLPVNRDADAFEQLRFAADSHEQATGDRPAILLACLGPIARHVGPANWAKSFFEAAGIEARNSVEVAAGKASPGAAAASPNGSQNGAAAIDRGEARVPGPAELGDVLKSSGCRIAAICAGKAESWDSISEAIATLRAGGAEHIYLAAPTPEQADSNTAEPDPARRADEIVRDGVDMVEVLTSALNRLGVNLGGNSHE